MIRSLKLVAALATALMLGAISMQPAFAATRTSPPTAGQDQSGQLSTLLSQLQQQQKTVNSLATQVESEQATVNTLNSKVSLDRQQEAVLNKQMDAVAKIEYERPALTLTTVLDARDLGQLLSGVAQARLIAKQQQSLFNAAATLKAKDEQDESAAQTQLDKISKQKAQATALAASTQDEIQKMQAQQAASSQSSAPIATSSAAYVATNASITLRPGPSSPNTFAPGQCTWYVAQIYSIPWNGNANQWPAGAAANGQAEGMTPVVGAIMESADSGFGHVSVVTSVTDANDWTVTEMNYMGPYVTDTRQVSRGSSNLVTFIY